jgi:DNA-directed RNA polymerase subunit RPC12/RpoP
MTTICMDCGAKWPSGDPNVDLTSHGFCELCGKRRLAEIRARAACGSELRRNDVVLDRCELAGRHDGKPHQGKHGKWARSSDAPAVAELRFPEDVFGPRTGRTAP